MQNKLLILLTTLFSVIIYSQDSDKSLVVLELFTSQGCSSCPPADQLLDEIKQKHKDDNVFVLSYHVDYWNRLGWKDPFSSEAFSTYQRQYGAQFGSRSIYTPQLVVNGSEHFTGSNHYKADIALKKYGKTKSLHTISLKELKKDNNTIKVQYEILGDKFNMITLALVVSERITKISRGENRNRTLKNTNIVAARETSKDKVGSIVMDIPNWITDKDELTLIAYTQDTFLTTTGAIRQKL